MNRSICYVRPSATSHAAYLAGGLALLIALSIIAASCSGPGTASQPAEREAPRQTYRIQVYMTADQSEAEQVAEQVQAWWQQLPAEDRPAALAASGLAPDVVWQQPYYRVRIGRFANRSEATPALESVRTQFDDAFLVPASAAPPASRR